MNDFGWDYPPGVSGNEIQIAGTDFFTMEAVCTHGDCHFVGKVDAETYDNVIWWQCPVCDFENAEAGNMYLDDDDAYDRQRDREIDERLDHIDYWEGR